MNRVQLLGRLAAKPELRYTPNGKAVTDFRIATNEREAAEFHEVTAFDRLAELIAEYTGRGSLVYVEGRLHTDAWKGHDGTPRRRVVVIAGNVQFLSRASERAEES